MKPYVLVLLIGTIVALSDLVGRGKAAKHERARVPFISAAAEASGRRVLNGDCHELGITPGLLALSSLLLLGVPAQAQEVEVGTSLVCDTQEQSERFVALYDPYQRMSASGTRCSGLYAPWRSWTGASASA
jgi:hypothetical protein